MASIGFKMASVGVLKRPTRTLIQRQRVNTITMNANRLSSSKAIAPSVPELLSYLSSGKTRPESNKVSALQQAYVSMNENSKTDFLLNLAKTYSIDVNDARLSMEAPMMKNDKPLSVKKVSEIRESLVPKYEIIFANIARENGLTFLLRLRADLLTLISSMKKQPDLVKSHGDLLGVMDSSLKDQLTTWFSVGFLNLKRITYEGTGGGILEKIARYETVHKVTEKRKKEKNTNMNPYH